MPERFERGVALMREMMGGQFAEAMQAHVAQGGFASDIARFAVEHAFGDVWSRDGLERKHRSMIVIAVLIAQGQPDELRNHVRFGLRNGLKPRDLEELVIQALPYVGFPAVSTALHAMIEVLRETGAETTASTAKEVGLL